MTKDELFREQIRTLAFEIRELSEKLAELKTQSALASAERRAQLQALQKSVDQLILSSSTSGFQILVSALSRGTAAQRFALSLPLVAALLLGYALAAGAAPGEALSAVVSLFGGPK